MVPILTTFATLGPHCREDGPTVLVHYMLWFAEAGKAHWGQSWYSSTGFNFGVDGCNNAAGWISTVASTVIHIAASLYEMIETKHECMDMLTYGYMNAQRLLSIRVCTCWNMNETEIPHRTSCLGALCPWVYFAPCRSLATVTSYEHGCFHMSNKT